MNQLPEPDDELILFDIYEPTFEIKEEVSLPAFMPVSMEFLLHYKSARNWNFLPRQRPMPCWVWSKPTPYVSASGPIVNFSLPAIPLNPKRCKTTQAQRHRIMDPVSICLKT